jgi:DNA-binding NtrC family response regulator
MNGSKLVLVSDDDEGIRKMLRRVLERHGFDVIEARGAAEAREKLARDADLFRHVFVDQKTEGSDVKGTDVLLALRMNPSAKGVGRTLMSSAGDPQELAKAAKELGATFRPKPFPSLADLLAELGLVEA